MYKYYYLYAVITTNKESKLGNSLYFGVHRTNNLNDGYIGSGKLLRKYLKSHPDEYERYILEYFDNEQDMLAREKEVVSYYLGRNHVLNLAEGGLGGNNFKALYEKDKTFNKGENNPMYGKNPYENKTEEELKQIVQKRMSKMEKYFSDKEWVDKNMSHKGENNPMYGKNIKDYMTPEKFEEFRKKQSKNRSEKNKKSRWMTDGVHRVFPTEDKFKKYLEMGYHFGQK